jgi:hypothetical protein
MSAVVACAALKLRRWRSWLSLALAVGLAGGAVLACLAAGRRIDTGYSRFARSHLAADVIVYPSVGADLASSNFDQVATLPRVKVAATPLGCSTDGHRGRPHRCLWTGGQHPQAALWLDAKTGLQTKTACFDGAKKLKLMAAGPSEREPGEGRKLVDIHLDMLNDWDDFVEARRLG